MRAITYFYSIFCYKKYENIQIRTLHDLFILLANHIVNLAKQSHNILQLRMTFLLN